MSVELKWHTNKQVQWGGGRYIRLSTWNFYQNITFLAEVTILGHQCSKVNGKETLHKDKHRSTVPSYPPPDRLQEFHHSCNHSNMYRLLVSTAQYHSVEKQLAVCHCPGEPVHAFCHNSHSQTPTVMSWPGRCYSRLLSSSSTSCSNRHRKTRRWHSLASHYNPESQISLYTCQRLCHPKLSDCLFYLIFDS